MEVVATGSGIKVPVGNQTLGRLFNVLGETIDGKEDLSDTEHWVIHREPPTFENQSPVIEILETGIKVIDLLAPYSKGGKIGLFGGAELVRQSLSRSLSRISHPYMVDTQYSPVLESVQEREMICGQSERVRRYRQDRPGVRTDE